MAKQTRMTSFSGTIDFTIVLMISVIPEIRDIVRSGRSTRTVRSALKFPPAARAGNRHFWLLSSLRAHTKAP